MQLVPNDIRTEDISETEPILSQPNRVEKSEVSSSSIELTACGDCSISSDDLPSPDVHENYSLVQTDQSQCRICLDSEGEDLIAPCHCKGTQKFVHRSCLDNWRSTKGYAAENYDVAIVGNCAYHRKHVQDKIRKQNGILLFLQQCVIDEDTPFSKERII